MLQKLLLKKSKIMILSLIFLLGSSLYAQEQAPAPEASSTPSSTEQVQTTETSDDKTINELEKNLEQTQKALQNTKNLGVGDPDDRVFHGKDTTISDLIDKGLSSDGPKHKKTNYAKDVKLALEPLQKLSEKRLLEHLKENTKGTSVEPYFNSYPKLTLYAVRLIKDTNAVPLLVSIVDDREKLIQFGAFMISTFIFAILLKWALKKERKFMAAFGFFLFRVFIVMSVRVGIIYYFYSTELTPAFNIFLNTFF